MTLFLIQYLTWIKKLGILTFIVMHMHNIEVYFDTYLTYHSISFIPDPVSWPLFICSPTDHLDTCTRPVVHTIKNSQCISLSKSLFVCDRLSWKIAWTQTFSFSVRVADCIDVKYVFSFNEILISFPATKRSTRSRLLPDISVPLTSVLRMVDHPPLHPITNEKNGFCRFIQYHVYR